MLQDNATSQANFDRFITRVREQRQVWGLKSTLGWAQAPSNEQDGIDVLVFWSDQAYASRHQKDEWKDYIPEAIPLDEFIDRWLKSMNDDGIMVGPNWDANLCGLEIEPIEVARLLSEI